MAYTPLYNSKVSEARGRGLILAIDSELQGLWSGLNDVGGSSWGDTKSLAIASGIVNFVDNYYNYILDTEGGAASDTLTKIAGVDENTRIIIRCASAAREITLSNGAFLKLQSDFILNSIYDNIVLVGAGSDICYEESRASNG